MTDDDRNKIIKLKAKSDRKKKDTTMNKAMNRAFIEDEAARNTSQERSIQYLKDKDEPVDRFLGWLWFVSGVIFAVTLENVVLNTPIVDWILNMFFTK